jgi:hypothetical protein
MDAESWAKLAEFLKKHKKVYNRVELAVRAFPGVSKRTIQRHVKSKIFSPTKSGRAPILGVDFEDELVKYAFSMAEMGFPIYMSDIVRLSREWSEKVGILPEDVGGKKWAKLFRKRHPLLVDRLAIRSGQERNLACCSDYVGRFLDLVELVKDIPAGRKWVVDEMGLMAENRDNKV